MLSPSWRGATDGLRHRNLPKEKERETRMVSLSALPTEGYCMVNVALVVTPSQTYPEAVTPVTVAV